jgi:hypothetical protein
VGEFLLSKPSPPKKMNFLDAMTVLEWLESLMIFKEGEGDDMG